MYVLCVCIALAVLRFTASSILGSGTLRHNTPFFVDERIHLIATVATDEEEWSQGKKITSQQSHFSSFFVPFVRCVRQLDESEAISSLYNLIESVSLWLCKSTDGRRKISQCGFLSWCIAKQSYWIILLTLCIGSLLGRVSADAFRAIKMVAFNFDWVHFCSKLPKSSSHLHANPIGMCGCVVCAPPDNGQNAKLFTRKQWKCSSHQINFKCNVNVSTHNSREREKIK